GEPTRPTRGRLLRLVLVVLIAGGIAAALDLKFVTGGRPRLVIANSLLVLNARTLDTVRNTPGRQAPAQSPVAHGAGLLWTVDRDGDRLIATAPESSRIVRNVVVGTEPVSVEAGAFAPPQILAVTSTDKAAGAMRSRLEPLGVTGVRASTFHSAALSQLRYFRPEAVGKILASKTLLVYTLVRALPAPFKFRA